MGFSLASKLKRMLRLWSITGFQQSELARYAENYIVDDVRRGVMLLGVLSLLMLSVASFLFSSMGFSQAYSYTFAMVALLALHITISTRGVKTTQMLYLLGCTLLVIAGTAFVLLAHKMGDFNAALLSSTVILFMLIPLVSCGLREATYVVVLIYLMYTASTLGVAGRFDGNTLLLLQFVMLASGFTALAVVATHVSIRKRDIEAHYELEKAHQEMKLLSFKDPLTGAWNRRFLEAKFNNLLSRVSENTVLVYFALIDLNQFKAMNDNFGHDAGDVALKHVVEAFRQSENDYVFRVGGDEFAVLTSSGDKLVHQAFEQLISERDFEENKKQPKVTVSVGMVKFLAQTKVTLKQLYCQADKLLYEAKHLSRNSGDNSRLVCHELTED